MAVMVGHARGPLQLFLAVMPWVLQKYTFACCPRRRHVFLSCFRHGAILEGKTKKMHKMLYRTVDMLVYAMPPTLNIDVQKRSDRRVKTGKEQGVTLYSTQSRPYRHSRGRA